MPPVYFYSYPFFLISLQSPSSPPVPLLPLGLPHIHVFALFCGLQCLIRAVCVTVRMKLSNGDRCSHQRVGVHLQRMAPLPLLEVNNL